ncbi:hypothetical protein AB0I10_30655 [Streptomyces sp. NPDC050636]|uniref:hypothetical protein n=1 Tax=Streptomyces sp. NPDC050636 TaxID=3154510 RepID=UPI0034487C11
MTNTDSLPGDPATGQLGTTDDEGTDLSFPYGRQAVAEAFLEFVTATPAGGTFYVTGSPGSGRSTLLTWLFLLSHSRQQDDGASTHPASPIFHAALGARGRGADDLAAALGRQLGYEAATAGELLSVLAADERPVCVVLGELDEAGPVPGDRHAVRVIEELLAPMAKLPNLRLVTEGAPEWARYFDDCEIVDIDQPRWTDRAAFDHYVAALCAYAGGMETGQRHDEQQRLFATSVAEAAYPQFLLAQFLVLEQASLTAAEAPPFPGSLPGNIHDAVVQHLRRLSIDLPLVADALYALALAGPSGLDHELWRLATAAVAGRQVTSRELDTVRERSQVLLHSDRPDESSADPSAGRYRLRHPAVGTALLALRPKETERQARKTFAHSLAGQVPVEPEADGTPCPLWSRTDPALLSTLIRQAAAVPGALGPLLAFPDVLLQADLNELRAAVDSAAEPAAVALRPVLALLHPASRDQTARLQVAALQHGLSRLAAAVASAHDRLPFRALGLLPAQRTAQPARESEGTDITITDTETSALEEVVVTGTGGVEIGRRAGGTPVLAWTLHGTPCTAAQATLLDGVPVVVVADREGLLQVRSPDDGRLLRPIVRTDEAAELLCVLTGAPDPLGACTAGDRLWVARLHDGSTLAELRFGSDITAIGSAAEGELDVDFGGSRLRLAFDLDLLHTIAGAAPSTSAPGQ